MIRALRDFFSAPAAQAAGADSASEDARAKVADVLRSFDAHPYLQMANWDLGLLSVFDDLRYDRADADIMTPAMRRHAIARLAPAGVRQVSGTVLENRAADIRILIPKQHALGASPFDITRYTPKRTQDLYLLTPTQAACQIIDAYDTDAAVARIKALIAKHPINLFRLMDYLEHTDGHRAFLGAIGHLRLVQREAVEADPLCRRRALG